MNSSGESKPDSAPSLQDEDSAVALLQHLNDERGKMFTEAEYVEMRTIILDELAHGARIRPFTVFTFGLIILGLAALLVIGLVTASGNAVRDYTLAIVSGLALLATCLFLWNLFRGIKQDSRRSLDARLEELEQVRRHNLISPNEFTEIQAYILIARQNQPAPRPSRMKGSAEQQPNQTRPF